MIAARTGIVDKDINWSLANASKQQLYNFMAFSPSDVVAATSSNQAVAMPNYTGQWIGSGLLPGTALTLETSTGSSGAATPWTRLMIRPNKESIKELQRAKMPLAKVYNMEFDLTCKKK